MNIPNYTHEPVVDKDGKMSSTWRQIVTQLLSELQTNFSNQGLVSPSQEATTITNLTNSNNGTLLYDSTNHNLVVNINGTFKKVTVS